MTLPLTDPNRFKIEYGTTSEDLGPRVPPSVEESAEDTTEEADAPQRQGKLAVHKRWPDGLAPKAIVLPEEPSIYAPLPRADYVVITWTVAELEALADVLTPGIQRKSWYRYARGFDKHYLPLIREGAPARKAKRLASYHLTQIGGAKVLLMKSELHLNQDGIMQEPEGYATLPVADLFKQIIEEAKPKLLITVGTAGAAHPEHWLGDVFITRAAKFRCGSEFKNAPYNQKTYVSKYEVPTGRLGLARELVRLQDEQLVEPDFAPPTGHYQWEGAPLPGTKNQPRIRVDGGGGDDDFAAGHPMLSTDFFEFGTTANNLWADGCALEMGDAALGLAVEQLGDQGCDWLVIRNASDPAINANLPPKIQSHWAVWYYEQYGYWTSVNSAIATWAIIAGDLERGA